MLEMTITAREADPGHGLKERRVLPFARRRMVGPFIFWDHAGPVTLPPQSIRGADVRPPLPPQYNDLPRVVVRGASANDPLGIPLLAVVFPDAASAAIAAPEIAAYLVLPATLVLVPPDATFTLRRSGSLLVIFQRTPSADPDPSAAESLLTVLSTLGEEIPLPR